MTAMAVLIILVALLAEDQMNGYFAGRRLLPQMKTSRTVFTEDGYRSVTEVGSSEFCYENIITLAETKTHIVFIFSNNHAQVYDKAGLMEGSLERFREFIQIKTGLQIQCV